MDDQMEKIMTSQVTWSVEHIPLPGQVVSGDSYVAEAFEGGTLIAVIDGLGHGEKAHEAAQAAVNAIKPRVHERPSTIMDYVHRSIRHTRGAVISIASIQHDGTMTWLGVGNVTAVLMQQENGSLQNREYLLVRGGIVGYRMPTLRPTTLKVNPGDTLIMISDGIRSSFTENLPLHQSPDQIAAYIMNESRRGTDDAIALVARFHNGA